jgi:hypothetical protein
VYSTCTTPADGEERAQGIPSSDAARIGTCTRGRPRPRLEAVAAAKGDEPRGFASVAVYAACAPRSLNGCGRLGSYAGNRSNRAPHAFKLNGHSHGCSARTAGWLSAGIALRPVALRSQSLPSFIGGSNGS